MASATDVSAVGRCTRTKLKAIGNKEYRLLLCQSKVAATNDTSGLAACEARATGGFSTIFGKAGSWCVGDEMTCENRADGCETTVAGTLTDVFPSPCEAAKRLAAGDLARRELRCYAKVGLAGLDPTCISKARARFSAALTAAGTCPDGGSPQTLVEDNCVNPVVATNGSGLVNSVCGTCDVFVLAWGRKGTGDGQFYEPGGVAVDGSGNVYVADANNCRIQKFTNDGTFLAKWGSCGTGDGQFNGPYASDLAVDGSGNVYVADAGNARIQKFTSDGMFVTKWAAFGSVAVDGSGHVYVADYGGGDVQKFTTDGTFLTSWGSFGSGDGQFGGSLGIAADGSGNVYVADAGNFRIQKFTSEGTFLTKWGSSGSSDGQFGAYARAIAVDGSTNVYVTDTYHARVQKFASDGTFLTKWGDGGVGDGRFAGLLNGVAVDGSYNVYVTDEYDGTGFIYDRIQRFAGCP